MECFLPGAGSTGFWAVLEPVFGAGAFAAGGHRLEYWLDTMTPEAMSFFQAWMRCQAEVRDMVGLVVGSYQGCSEELHALAREVAEERARTEWRQMGARSEHEALGIFVHDVHRRWGSVFWRSWARVIRGRLPAIGRPNAGILDHGPPPAYARGQAAVGGAEPWPRVQPGVLRGLRAAAGL